MAYPAWKNSGSIRLMIIVGTRPEIIRLSAVIPKARRSLDTLVMHTGQNYDYCLNGSFFRELGLGAPDIQLETAGRTLGDTLGNILTDSYRVLKDLMPDAVLVLGDTNSCLAAIAAKRLHIPVFHMEAGNRCFDECLPEEINRRIVDTVSDVNLAYTEHARRNLLMNGLPSSRIFVTGSPMAEVLTAGLPHIMKSDVPERLGLKKQAYMLLSAHREENIDTEKNFGSLIGAVNRMAESCGLPVLYSCHPRARKKLEQENVWLDPRVILHEPFGFFDYCCLQINAFCVISDSGTLPEESAFFASQGMPFPAVSLRTSTERPEALEKGSFVLSGIHAEGLLQAVRLAVSMIREGGFSAAPVPDYRDLNVSDKVIRIIQSCTGIVNQTVWRKEG